MERWRSTIRPLVILGVIIVMAWFPFVRDTRVPLLGWADLGFHELGHLIGYIIPISERLTAALGSITQVAVPLGLAVYFLRFRSDSVAGGLMLAWAGTSAADVAVYIADAPYERLPLIGGDHDWAFLLGPSEFDILNRADDIAAMVSFLALALVITGGLVCAAVPIRNRWALRRARRHGDRFASLPVREARWNGEAPDGRGGNTLPG